MFTECSAVKKGFCGKSGESRLVFRKMATEYTSAMMTAARAPERYGKEIDRLSKTRGRIMGALGRSPEAEREAIWQLGLKKSESIRRLAELQKPIENKQDFSLAAQDVQSYASGRHFLHRREFDAQGVQIFLDSDISSFFSLELTQKLERAQMSMYTATQVAHQMGIPVQIPRKAWSYKAAKDEWRQQRKVLEAEGHEKEAWIQKQALEIEVRERMSAEARRALGTIQNNELAEEHDEHVIRHLDDKIHDDEVRAQRIEIITGEVKKKNLLSVADKLSFKDKREVNDILLEVAEMRLEQMRRYLQRRLKGCEAKFEAKKGLYTEQQRIQIEAVYRDGYKRIEQSRTLDELKATNERLDLFERNLNESNAEVESDVPNLEAIQENPSEVKTIIERQFAAIQGKVQGFRNVNVEVQKEELRLAKIKSIKRAQQGIRESSVDVEVTPADLKRYTFKRLAEKNRDFGEDIAWLESLPAWYTQGTEQCKELQVVEKWISRLNDDRPDPSEMQQLLITLGDFQNRLRLMPDVGRDDDAILDDDPESEKLADAHKAREVINQLQGMTDVNAVKAILRKSFDESRLEFVGAKNANGQTFENYRGKDGAVRNLKEYSDGAMVFRQCGDEWSIIVDEDALDAGVGVADFVDQVSHELKHVELENNTHLRETWMRAYTENPRWSEIKQAFVSAYPTTRPGTYAGDAKSAYNVDDWQDADIVSELYATQDQLARDREKLNAPKQQLTDLLADTGIAASTMGIPQERFLGMKGTDDEATVSDILASAGEGDAGGESAPMKAVGSAKNYQDQLDDLTIRINEVMGSEYLNYMPGSGELIKLMRNYNDRTKALNAEFAKSGNAEFDRFISERIKNVKKDVAALNSKLAEVGGDIPNKKIGPFRRLWNKTSFLSIEDVIQVGKDGVEFMQRRHKRKMSDHAARLGEALLQGTPMGPESRARREKAEQEEVQEWQSRYESLDAWELLKIVGKISRSPDPSKDELKAVLRILAKKGRLDWRQPELWNALNKLQSSSHLTPGDPVLLHNPPLLSSKLHTALGAIWDYDEYLQLKKDNEDAYESGKKKYEPTYDQIQDVLTERLETMFLDFQQGKQVDPQEFEAGIEYAIEKGKSFQEAALFYLIAGMASGLLAPDRGMSLDKHLNTWPATQWIYNQAPPLNQADYQRVAERYFGQEYGEGAVNTESTGPGTFKGFYWTVVLNDRMTLERVQKSVSERGWDHDWSRGIAPLNDASGAKKWLQGKSGQEEVKITGVANAYTGALQWFEENAHNANQMDFRKHFARQIGFVAMSDAILDGVAYQNSTGAPFTRAGDNIWEAKARLSDVSNHPDWTMRRTQEKMKRFLAAFDPVLFGEQGLLRDIVRSNVDRKNDRRELTEEIKAHLFANYTPNEKRRQEWESIADLDNVFNKLDAIINTMMQVKSDDEILGHIRRINSGEWD